jgi:hypothetical protein
MRPYVEEVRAIQATLETASGVRAQRQAQCEVLQEQFETSDDPIRHHMGQVMASFAPGLFVGGEDADWPQDNLDLERWFRQPKGHERRMHGHRHAGVRLVQEGPTLLLALDAHLAHPEPFTAADVWPYRHSPAPACQRSAMHRRTIMRQARSKKKRLGFLAKLERRYLDDS